MVTSRRPASCRAFSIIAALFINCGAWVATTLRGRSIQFGVSGGVSNVSSIVTGVLLRCNTYNARR